MDEWDPTEKDLDWLLNTVRMMKIGGLWNLPAPGATFEKVGQDHLKLKSVETDDLLKAMIAIEKTKKVGEKAGIKVDIEEACDSVFLRLKPESFEYVNLKSVKKMNLPSEKEVLKFMRRESKPYKFECSKDIQPLRVNVERKIIYVNRKVLMNVISDLVKHSLDWKNVMRKSLLHEKTHEKYQKWIYKWGVGAVSYGWLPSYLIDIVIDKIHFKDNERYQKWLLADSRHAFKDIKKNLRKLFPRVSDRPHFLYNQAAYWVATDAVTLDEVANLYPEKADYIVQMSRLFDRIKNEQDLEWAFPQAKRLHLENFKKV